ncbi:MAG: carbamoyltransferase C-terminal domain-containing protein [Candidatus Nanopelagicales bacterium]|nr:carbamoyltransferase C-terminal domain-containing protein [Candidatus Nanopelagicales bacterium]
MIVGLALSHDASAALTDSSGRVIAAIGEERLSRRKNHRGIPTQSLAALLELVPPELEVTRLVIGSHESLPSEDARRFLADLDDQASNPRGTARQARPGWRMPSAATPMVAVEDAIRGIMSTTLANASSLPIVWQNHHLSHLGTALGVNSSAPTLLISLDGEGDGESGAVAVSDGNLMRVVGRIPAADSLGLLYSAITARYNFTPTRHEGKITGLAAYGASSAAVDILRQHVEVRAGIPFIRYPKSFKARLLPLALRRLKPSRGVILTMDDIADLAADGTANYADLAFAIQQVLEESVCEMVDYWITRTGLRDIALAGGVFSNVKLNQRLAELPATRSVTVFPNMGDGGLALGGIWSVLKSEGGLDAGPLYSDMFLAPETDQFDDLTMRAAAAQFGLDFEAVAADAIAGRIAQIIVSGGIVGWHEGAMEFGPRALGHRSILLDPRHRESVDSLNARLHRTEFMPFAPVVLRERFNDYFETGNASMQPFEYMTMTCTVRPEFHSVLQGVTHVDGTARPQIIDADVTPNYYNIVAEFGRATGIYVLVNTSFNTHEEPINGRLEDSISALMADAVDVLATPAGFLRVKAAQ